MVVKTDRYWLKAACLTV